MTPSLTVESGVKSGSQLPRSQPRRGFQSFISAEVDVAQVTKTSGRVIT